MHWAFIPIVVILIILSIFAGKRKGGDHGDKDDAGRFYGPGDGER